MQNQLRGHFTPTASVYMRVKMKQVEVLDVSWSRPVTYDFILNLDGYKVPREFVKRANAKIPDENG